MSESASASESVSLSVSASASVSVSESASASPSVVGVVPSAMTRSVVPLSAVAEVEQPAAARMRARVKFFKSFSSFALLARACVTTLSQSLINYNKLARSFFFLW